MDVFKVQILGEKGEAIKTITFSEEAGSDTIIHPDDSIRTIKMKILQELHNGKRSNQLQIRPSYEEMYLYAFVQEETTTLRLFDTLKTAEDPDPAISKHVIAQMLSGHPKAESILKKIPSKFGENVPYSEFESLLSEKKLTLSVKTPLGIQFARGRRDASFEVDPFEVEKRRAYLTEHNNLYYFDDSLLLNYGAIVDNTIYLCLADRVYESSSEAEQYISRYYFPGLYKAGVDSKESLVGKRTALTKRTIDTLTDSRLQYYQSIQQFYQIAASDKYPAVNYSMRGIQNITLRLKNVKSHTASLEMLFRNMHCSKDIPYIKYNPGNRRENLYRFYFERTTRTGKKVPYLSRSHIMRMSKETGKSQQISAYLESIVISEKFVDNCYAHFERTGDIQVQLAFSKPIDETELNSIVISKVIPQLSALAKDVKQTGFLFPEYTTIRDEGHVQIINMEIVVKAPAQKPATWESVPCIYSICTLHSETPGAPPLARLKRVENFKEMDAARILITELYGEVQYGELSLQDIVEELVIRKLVDTEDASRMLIAEVLSTMNEINGEIVERPGFPMQMTIDAADKVVEIRVSDITSMRYLDTLSVYIEAIIKMTQIIPSKAPVITQLDKLCKNVKKFKEVESPQEVTPARLKDVVTAPSIAVAGPSRFVKSALDDDFFAQFADEDDNEQEYHASEKVGVIEEPEADVVGLLDKLRNNAKQLANPITFEDDDGPPPEKKSSSPFVHDKSSPRAIQSFGAPDKQVLTRSMVEDEYDSDNSPTNRVRSAYEKKSSPQVNLRSADNPSQRRESRESNASKDSSDEIVSTNKKDGAAIPDVAKNVHPPPQAKKKPIDFDDDDENFGGAKKNANDADDDADDSDSDDINNRIVPDDIPLKPVNPFLKKLRKRDPVLFVSKPSGKYKAFSVSCQPTSRHPVILTQDEFDKTDKNAYEHSIKYGSDPTNQHHFICPRFWCFLTNSAISPEDVKDGKCGGKIIPKSAKAIPKGAYIYELNESKHYPGFIENTRPDGKCLPCCFKSWDGKTQKDARERCEKQMTGEDGSQTNPLANKKKSTALAQKTAQYIYSLDTYPVPPLRWGYLPIPVQLFLNMDYRPAVDPNNPALLLPDKQVLLRYGVEQSQHQSFLGVFAHIYAHRQELQSVPSVAEFKKTLAAAIDLDVFARAHNGSLLSAFYPNDRKTKAKSKSNRTKYENTEFGLNIDFSNKSQKRHFEDAVAAYENFMEYLTEDGAKIDHQYLWDLVCEDNANLIPRGLNLIILEIKANDMIDRIELVCPTNLYSNNQFDAKKDSVILLKHDDIYEPVFLYTSNNTAAPTVVRFLKTGQIPQSIADVLKNVELTTKRFCPGLPSLPKIYKFASPMHIQRVLESLLTIDAKVESQVVNYQGKTIGLMVLERGSKTSVYVPCAASAKLKDAKIETKYMDDLDIVRDYGTTTSTLNRISLSAKIPCKPVWKIKEGGLVVGFLTETNQFVPVKPNEDIVMDGLRTYEGVDAFDADKTFATETKGDRTRAKMTKYIMLESQFYHAFRNRVRSLMNQIANRKIMREIKKIAEDKTEFYKHKINQIEKLLEDLIADHIIFVDIDKPTLMKIFDVNDCEDASDKSETCVIKENDGVAQLVMPKWHLLSKYDNERIYVGRMADELIRNDRVKSFMYDVENRLNAKNVEYSIHHDEFILVQSALTPDYFSELDSTSDLRAKHTNYELANPSISVLHPNEKIPLAEQYQRTELVAANEDDDVATCLVKIVPIIGNPIQIWRKIFSENAREWVYRDTVSCTFQPIIKIVEDVKKETWTEPDIRRHLWAGYSVLFEKTPGLLTKVVGVMRKQGKSKMFERVARNAKLDSALDEFESIIMSDNYHLVDMDIWILATGHRLPIILFNPNGLKGFFSKSDVQWLKMGGAHNAATKYHFIRSNIGSYPNKIYEYNLVVPAVKLSDTKMFEAKVAEAMQANLPNTYELEDALSKIAFVETKALKAAAK
jgi:hypothetical protein